MTVTCPTCGAKMNTGDPLNLDDHTELTTYCPACDSIGSLWLPVEMGAE